MKQLLISTAIFVSMVSHADQLFAQSTFELPQNIQLKTKDDYVKYETTLVEAATWLEETDLDKEEDKRGRVNAFVIQYVSGTSAFSVAITSGLMKLFEKNEQLMALYLASYAKHAIENKGASSMESTKAGLVSMLTVYKKGIRVTKNKEMEKVLKLTDTELDDYVSAKLMK